MTEPTLNEKRETLRARIFADTLSRMVRWLAFGGIVGGLALPMAYDALRERGAAVAVAVLALAVGLAWHVKPHGRSAAAQCRDIEARFKPHD